MRKAFAIAGKGVDYIGDAIFAIGAGVLGALGILYALADMLAVAGYGMLPPRLMPPIEAMFFFIGALALFYWARNYLLSLAPKFGRPVAIVAMVFWSAMVLVIGMLLVSVVARQGLGLFASPNNGVMTASPNNGVMTAPGTYHSGGFPNMGPAGNGSVRDPVDNGSFQTPGGSANTFKTPEQPNSVNGTNNIPSSNIGGK